MKLTRFALFIAASFIIACWGLWAAAGGPPNSGFPDRIPFNFDQSPEGVAVDKFGNIYVSLLIGTDPSSQHDEIWKFAPSGEKSVLVQFPTPGRVGLAVDAVGNVYFARTGPDAGVYVIAPDGYALRLPGTEKINYPNGLAFDQQGNLYITDMVSLESEGCMGMYGQGGLYRFPRGGTSAELWLRHELLTGTCPGVLGIPGGANGIQFYLGDLYVMNSDKHRIVRVPVMPDGSPGEPSVWAMIQPVPESPLANPPFNFATMGDGFTFDVHGNAYVAVVSHCAIVKINADDFSQETIAVWPFDAVDAATSLAFGTGKGERTSIFIANMGWLALFGIPIAPGPSLMKIDVGIPGLPLP